MTNISDFLYDIPGDSACGEYLRYSQIYDDIREAKREDDPRLSQGVWKIEVKKADWKKVIELCSDVLQNRSKDLQIASWLVEAYTAINGWEGMYDGLSLIHALCDKFWENIYPHIEDDDYEYRLSPIVALISKIANMSLLLPITNPQDENSKARTLSDWIEARYNAKISQNTNQEFDILHESINTTDDMFIIKLEHIIQQIIQVIAKLDDFLSSKTNNESPSFGQLINNVSDISVILNNVIESRNLYKWDVDQTEYTIPTPDVSDDPQTAPTPDLVDANNDTHDTQESQTNDEDPLSKATLDQAFAALYQIAAFIEKHEPQSPVATLIKLALILRKKTFTELMSIQTKDGDPVVLCISKLYNAFNETQPAKFDKSIFDNE